MGREADRADRPRAERVDIYEEWDDEASRLMATFELRLYEDDHEVDEDEDVDWDHAEMHWTEEDWARHEAHEREAIRNDPHKGLTIDAAIALARTYADKVTVWLDHHPWDASETPRTSDPVWPPATLDLRPRWPYEPADSTRAAGWWVRFYVDAEGLTPDIARACVEALPSVLEVRRRSPCRRPTGVVAAARSTR